MHMILSCVERTFLFDYVFNFECRDSKESSIVGSLKIPVTERKSFRKETIKGNGVVQKHYSCLMSGPFVFIHE